MKNQKRLLNIYDKAIEMNPKDFKTLIKKGNVIKQIRKERGSSKVL